MASEQNARRRGINLIVIYNSGRDPMAVWGSLAGLMPYGTVNPLVKGMACQVLTMVDSTSVLAVVCAADPCVQWGIACCGELKGMGFSEFPQRRADCGTVPGQP
ncbi:MAG: phosphoenolpyruvate hydrolase family protein [Planctomycetaceae bacterium]|nr:phosphoenolpyruvate hydrolase family protein [Planctomycetaceae bacterium]